MKKVLIIWYLLIVCAHLYGYQIRQPSVAGAFYPQESLVLNKALDTIFEHNKTIISLPSQLVALIVPHAGYAYSGNIAGAAYANLSDKSFDTIVLVGPQHKKEVKGAAIWSTGAWQSPLGKVAVDTDFAAALIAYDSRITNAMQIHEGEHSLEVQIPFLQRLQPNARIVPILINDMKFASILASAILSAMQGSSKRILVIASSDMSHYLPDVQTRARDSKTYTAIESLTPQVLENVLATGKGELCGAAAVSTVMHLLKRLPDAHTTLLQYKTSADVTHDNTSSVGYIAVAGCATVASKAEKLSLNNQKILLTITRNSLEHLGVPTPALQIKDAQLIKPKAVFVTLRDSFGNLRGCIGRFVAEEPLWQAVYNMTQEAALQDSRFPPVTFAEISSIRIEISVLDAPRIVSSITDIKYPGHGVIIERGYQKGVFLPEVAEQFATKDDFLNTLCTQKAHLEKECWLHPQTTLQVFETEHFSE